MYNKKVLNDLQAFFNDTPVYDSTEQKVTAVMELWNNFQDDLLTLIKNIDYNNNKEIEQILINSNEHRLIKIIRSVQQ